MEYFIAGLYLITPIIMFIVRGFIEDEGFKEITYFVLNIVYLKFCLSYAPYIRNIDSSIISNICILGFVSELICFICLGIGGLRGLNKKD